MNENELFEKTALPEVNLERADGRYLDRDVEMMWQGWAMRADVQPHCITCQCARVNQPKPVPKNEQSKSWHMDAPTTKPG